MVFYLVVGWQKLTKLRHLLYIKSRNSPKIIDKLNWFSLSCGTLNLCRF